MKNRKLKNTIVAEHIGWMIESYFNMSKYSKMVETVIGADDRGNNLVFLKKSFKDDYLMRISKKDIISQLAYSYSDYYNPLPLNHIRLRVNRIYRVEENSMTFEVFDRDIYIKNPNVLKQVMTEF